MKKCYATLFFLATLFAATAQSDTLLFENFTEDPTAEWGVFPNSNDTIWIMYDEDQSPANGNIPEEMNWFYAQIFHNSYYPDTTPNYALQSLSFMADLSVQNLNWLITPPIWIYDDNAMLHWSSAPFQLPRYMDGYKVLISSGSNDTDQFTDTLFVAAEMTEIVAASGGATIDLDSFAFSAGYFHADMLTDTNYFKVFDADSTLCRGLLEPHSVSLAAYAGQQIYIAFLHDSFDDFYFALDDILVTGTLTSASHETTADNFRLVTYPNPVDHWLNVSYRLEERAEVSLQVIDLQGKIIRTVQTPASQNAGEYSEKLNLSDLPGGNYLLNLRVNEQQVSRTFIKVDKG